MGLETGDLTDDGRVPFAGLAPVGHPLDSAAMNLAKSYHDVILWIGDGTGLPDAILHIHAGLAVLMVARLILGRSLGTFIPFGFVVLAEAGNEILDRLAFGAWRWPDTLADIGNTLFWPFVISLAVRVRPMIHRDRRAHPLDEAP